MPTMNTEIFERCDSANTLHCRQLRETQCKYKCLVILSQLSLALTTSEKTMFHRSVHVPQHYDKILDNNYLQEGSVCLVI